MSDDSEDIEKRTYEVGYGKPPKQHQIKPKSPSMHDCGAKKAKGRKSANGTTEKVNLAALLSEPVRVRKHEQVNRLLSRPLLRAVIRFGRASPQKGLQRPPARRRPAGIARGGFAGTTFLSSSICG